MTAEPIVQRVIRVKPFSLAWILDGVITLTAMSLCLVAIPNIFRENPHYWAALLQFFGNGNDKIATFWMTHAYHLVLFVFFNSLVGICYYGNFPAIERFKTEPGPWPWRSPNEEERTKFKELLKSTVLVVLCNNLFISVPLSWFSYDSARSQGLLDPSIETFPSTFTIIWQVAVCILVEDCLFYWSHRLLHIPFLFRHIHKVHHKYHCPIGAASEYAHPLEFYFGNLMPTAMGPALVKTHLFTYFIWIGVRLAKTCEAHCGYSFPFSPFQFLPFANPAAAHDYHHARGINTCFGSFLCFWDTLSGTNKEFCDNKPQRNLQDAIKSE